MATVKFTLDPNNPPKMTDEERERWQSMRDEDIDFSDIPELDDAFWANAKRRRLRKEAVSLRLDADVIAHFKGEDPKGYTGRMADVLRAYVTALKSS